MTLTLAIEYLTNVRPAKHWEDIYPVILTQFTAPLVEFLKNERKVTPRINIMIPIRTFRWLWLRRYFFIWGSVGMENQPDVNIVFPVSHGVTGECFRARIPIYATPEALKGNYKFPRHLRPLTEGIQAIISYPIYEPARKGRQSGRLIGVINLDSKTANAYSLLTEEATRAVIDEKMQGLAVLIGQIYH